MTPAEKGFFDPVYFCRYYLSEWFPDAIPWFHRGIMAIHTRSMDWLPKYGQLDKIERHFRWLDADGRLHPIFDFESMRMVISPNSNIIVPRGFGKTTLLNGLSVRDCAYRFVRYLLYISESATHSEDQIIAQKREWESNALLLKDFGPQAADRNESRRWTNEVLEFRNGVFVRGIGRGGQVRGKQFRSARPNKIVVDDVEDEESVQSPTQLRKVKYWFYSSVLRALPPEGRRAPTDGVVCLGTLLSTDCLIAQLGKDPTFNTVVLGAVDLDGEALWPEHQSLKQIEAEREVAKRTGTLDIFYREKLSTIRLEEDRAFPEDSLIVETPDLTKMVSCAIACDPAISESRSASRAAVYCVARDERGFTWVLDGESGTGWSPRELVDRMFGMRNRWRFLPCGVRFVGIEAINYQRALVFLMREEMARRGDYFEVTPITHGQTSKFVRISGVLQPRYAARVMRHAREFPVLFGDLRDWPNGKLDDIDAVAMGVALLEPFTGVGAAPGDSLDQNEYAPLAETFGRHCP